MAKVVTLGEIMMRLSPPDTKDLFRHSLLILIMEEQRQTLLFLWLNSDMTLYLFPKYRPPLLAMLPFPHFRNSVLIPGISHGAAIDLAFTFWKTVLL